MSPADKRYWQAAQRRVAGMQSDVAAALLRAFAIIRDGLTEAQLVRVIESGDLERLIREALSDDVLDRAFIPLRSRLRQTTEKSFTYALNDMPRGGKVQGEIAVSFDYLNPRVVDAIRDLDTRVITTLADEQREVVRRAVKIGLEEGRPHRTIAREIRDVIGLSPRHVEAVNNFRRSLEGDEDAGSPLDRKLRDKRFDAKIKRGELTSADIERMTERYRQRMQANVAETVSRTAVLDSYRKGQDLAWKDARDKGVVPEGFTLVKSWIQVQRPNKRPEHALMHGETVPIDRPYSNGQMIPGEDDFNCACLSRVKVVRVGARAAA